MIRLLKLGLVCLLVFALVGTIVPATAQQDSIRLLAYEGYADKSLYQGFEQQTGIRVDITPAATGEDILSGMRSNNGGDFDVVTATSDLWGKLVEQNLVKPVDVSQISNYTQLSQMMRSVPAATGGQVYAVPIAWASDVLVYNTDVFPQPPNSYAVLFDPKFKGKVAGWDNSATLGVTGLYLGYKQPFSTTKKQLDAVKKLLCKQFPLVLLYGAQAGDYVNAFKDGDAVVGLASGLLITNALRKGNVNNVDWTIPKEGALIRVDGVLLSNGSGNSQAAQQLIDYLLSPQIQQQISERLGSAPANSAAYEQLPGEIKQQLARQQPDQNPNLRFELWSQVENYDTWTQTWNDIKAGC